MAYEVGKSTLLITFEMCALLMITKNVSKNILSVAYHMSATFS